MLRRTRHEWIWILFTCGWNLIEQVIHFSINGNENHVWFEWKKNSQFWSTSPDFHILWIYDDPVNWMPVWTEPFVRHVKLLSYMFDVETHVFDFLRSRFFFVSAPPWRQTRRYDGTWKRNINSVAVVPFLIPPIHVESAVWD